MEQIYEKLYEAFVPPWPRRRRPQPVRPVSPILTGSASVSRPRRRRTSGTRRCQRGPLAGRNASSGASAWGPADAGPPLRRGRGAGDKNALPSPVIGTRAFQTLRGATQIQACGHAPLTLCCGRGTAPVSGPAGGAVFSGAVSVRSFQPRDLSLSGGVPDTHAPSWRWTLSAAARGRAGGMGRTSPSDGEGDAVGVHHLAPVQVSPAQTMDQQLSGGHVGGHGDGVLVTQLGDGQHAVVQLSGAGSLKNSTMSISL